MSTLNFDKHSFLTITNGDSVTISGNEGWTYLSVSNRSDSVDNVSISGSTDKIGGLTPNDMELVAGDSIALGGNAGGGIDTVTITAGASCTCRIYAVKTKQNI